MTVDGTQIAPNDGHWQPLAGTFVSPDVSYLHERDHKRELRLQSAQEGTQIGQFAARGPGAQSGCLTCELCLCRLSRRKPLWTSRIRNWTITTTSSPSVSDRFKAGDLAQIDLDRIELQRVQYESDLQAAEVDLRTAKIQLLQLLNHRTPVDRFDIQGPFDFTDQLQPLDTFRQIALNTRPT